MRSAEQIGRTVGEWHDYQRAERERTLRSLLEQLTRARETHEPWYQWVVAKAEGRHLHGANDERGRRLACPSCDHERGASEPHRVGK